ncbi:MAG: cyclopropane-fatty-acyl-phospholipid synthase family protein [Pseudomonadota bacterium]
MTSHSKTMTTNADDVQNAIILTAENLNEALAGLPRKAAMVMRKITLLRKGSLTITVPTGQTFHYTGPEPGPHGQAVLANWGVVRRVLSNGSLGVAESYIEEEWSSPDVTSFLELFLANSYGGGAEGFFNRNRLMAFFSRINHWWNRNSKAGSKRNISAHYDLGNRFYEQWLDPSMTYSSALFQEGANSLEEAQEHKYRALARSTDIQPHHHVLEIGCGWGGFAEYVAGKIGAKVTCLTISREQFDFATQRMAKAGLSDKVTIKFQDYRDETGTYDRIGSIEMFEAVGEAYWPCYFSQLHACLKPQGRAGLQVITIKDQDLDHYRANPDFIQKYIFPGGMLPSVEGMEALGRAHAVPLVADRAFGHDYAATLEEWRHRFWAKWETIKPLGFDARFKRIWEFYFHYCEAGFKVGSIDVRQMVFEKA